MSVQIRLKSLQKKVNSEKNKNILLLLLVLLYLFMGVGIANQWKPFDEFAQVDFNTYYAAAKLFYQRENIYDGSLSENLIRAYGLEYISGSDYIYTPFLAFALTPLTRLPPLAAGFIWYTISFLSLCAAVWLIVKSGATETFDWRTEYRDALILALIYVPTAYSFYVGQVNAILLLLLVATFYLIENKNELLAGIVLSLAILMKVVPVLVVMYLFGRRKLKSVFVTLLCLVLYISASLLLIQEETRGYLTVVLPSLAKPEPHPVNQSLNGFFSRLLTRNDYTIPILDMPGSVWIGVSIASLILLGIIMHECVVVFRKTNLRRTESLLLFGQVITLMVVISPLAWENFYILLLFPILVLYSKRDYLGWVHVRILVGSFLLITAQRFWDPFVNSPSSYAYLRHFSVLMSLGLYGALLLLLTQVALLERCRSGQL